MSAQLELIPNDAALVDQEGKITRRWYIWLLTSGCMSRRWSG
jgi:hypothetical protein